MLGFIGAIIIGFVIGLIARALMPGRDAAGFILTTLLGIGGALLGKYLGQILGFYREDQPAGFFMSVVGALVILLIYNLVTKRTSTH